MLTLEQYTLFTGITTTLDDEQWESIVTVAEMRLASFLCLEELPELDDNNQDLAMLLANFIAAVLKFQGDGDAIESKSVRNFTINFKTSSASNAFAQIASQYEDIIDRYSECGLGVVVERSRESCCGQQRGCCGQI